MEVILGTSLQKSRVLQETAAAIQQIILLPVSPGRCFQQQLHSLEGMINEKWPDKRQKCKQGDSMSISTIVFLLYSRD